MGNFIFDQSSTGPTSQGLAVGVAITADKATYYLFPLKIEHGQTSLMSYSERVKLLNILADESTVAEFLKNYIKNGVFSLDNI